VYFVYILLCADGSFYVGCTRNVKRRVETHNAGRGPAFTRHRRPAVLVLTEFHPTKNSAVRRERQLKGWSRKKKEALIQGDLDGLHALAKRRN
jgi:putative endonuclease